MNLWRLEWLRLTRTRRLVAIVGVYLFFGLTGPLTARYLGAGNLGDIGRWLPTSLAGALAGLVRDTTPGQYLPATSLAVAVTAAALASAVVFGERREI